MKKQNNTNLSYTINIKDFVNNEVIINHLFDTIKTSLELNEDDYFLNDMSQTNEINL